NKYYCFKGFVDKVMNKPYIYYDSCKTCSASIQKNSDTPSCRKRNEEDVEIIPRFRIVLQVVSENESAFVTLFEDAATVYVGCKVDQYIQSING
ncbi:Unknown protein, partial [Striga hermonthica]